MPSTTSSSGEVWSTSGRRLRLRASESGITDAVGSAAFFWKIPRSAWPRCTSPPAVRLSPAVSESSATIGRDPHRDPHRGQQRAPPAAAQVRPDQPDHAATPYPHRPCPGPLADLDVALLRVARRAGHTPAREAAVARFSALGEHGIRLARAGGAPAALLDPRGARAGLARARRWRCPTGQPGDQGRGAPAAPRAARRAAAGVHTHAAAPSPARTPPRPSRPRAPWRRCCPAPRSYAVAAALALSRLYLGVHYPSDIVAGAALGRPRRGRCAR